MPKFKEILDELSVEEIVSEVLKMEGACTASDDRLNDIANKTKAAKYQAVADNIKSLKSTASDSNYGIAVMYLPTNPSFSDSDMDVCVYGYAAPTYELYDISNAKWEDVINMNICESSLAHLLPAEIAAAIIREIACDKEASPDNPEIKEICEDDFSRDGTYKALGIPDDRTDLERNQDHLDAQRDFAEVKAAVFKFIH